MQIDDLEEAEVGERGEDIDFGGVLAEELDGADAVGVEDVMDVMGEIVPNGRGWDGDTRCPLFDEGFDVKQAVVAGGFEVFGELGGGDAGCTERFRANGPDGGDPGETGAGVPLAGEIEPLAGANFFFDGVVGF